MLRPSYTLGNLRKIPQDAQSQLREIVAIASAQKQRLRSLDVKIDQVIALGLHKNFERCFLHKAESRFSFTHSRSRRPVILRKLHPLIENEVLKSSRNSKKKDWEPIISEADFFKDLEASIMSAKDYAPSEIAAALHNGLLT